jgi:hypothetical protein
MLGLYLNLGIQHIIDFLGYDHILFLICLTAVYVISQWKRLLVLITAFTAGHTASLILATFNVISFPTEWIEFLIPLTIFITALWNVLDKKGSVSHRGHYIKYGAALFFGLIHGLGFSFYLKNLLSAEDSIAIPLLGFNLGIEIGQIIIVSVILTFSFLLNRLFKFRQRVWNLIISSAGMGVSLYLMIVRFPL